MDNIKLGITITADGKGAESTINSLNKTIEKTSGSAGKAADGMRKLESASSNLGSAASVAARALGTLGVAISVRGMYDTIASFEKLNASLKTVTGSTKTASDAMAMIRQFAQETPYDVQQVTEAFIRLRSLGLDATAASLRSYGNTAAAMGKPMMQFIEAVADATTNEFERLKEFGIKAKQEGDEVTLTFRGASTTIKKDAQEIEKYLKRIGDIEFAGGMADQMNTLDGAMSNFKDSWANLVDFIGSHGIGRMLRQDLQFAAEILDTFTKGLNATFGSGIQSQIDGMTVSIRKLKEEIFYIEETKGTFWDRIFGTSTDLEKRKAELADMQARLAGLQAQQRASTGNVGAASPLETVRSGRPTEGSAGGSRIISAASTRLGKSESNPGDLVKFLNDHSGTVFRNLTVPWCARYVSAVLNSSGVGGLKTARARDYLGFGQSVWSPNMGKAGLSRAQPGDIAVFARGRGMGHVGFVKSVDPDSGRLQILGGNQSNAVTVSSRSTAGLLGIRRATGKATDFESAETFRRKEIAASESAYKKQQEARKKAQEEYKRQQEDAYRLFSERLDRQAQLTDASLQVDASKQKIALEKLGNEYDQWSQRNQLQIEVAFDQKSYEEQIRLINEAQAKSEQYIRGMNRLSGGDDSAAVQSLTKEIKLIDEKIAKVKATTRDETEIEKLKDERLQKTKEREKASIEATSGNLELQKSLAENAAKYDALRQQAGEKVIAQQNQQMDIAQRLGGVTVDAAKGIIDSNTEQLKSQVAINAAQREAEINANKSLTTLDKQREAIKGRLADTITVVEAEKQASLEKLAIDQGMLAYEEEILRVRLAATKTIQDRIELESKLAENAMAQAVARKAAADIEVNAAKEIAKAQTDATTQNITIDANAFKEQQLELNAFWDQYMARLQDYASLWEQITGESANGWAKMSLAAGEYFKQFNQIGDYWKSDAGKNWGDLAPMMEGIQQAEAALVGMAKTLMALRSNYAEGSQAYKDMTSAAERMMEVQRVLAVVEGVVGVLHQLGSGDPYTAPARAAMAGAIVAAQLASIGMSSAAVPGFSNKQAQQSAQAGGSTSAGGGVFGDTSAKSESISKALDIVAENSSANLSYSAGMLRSLKNIELAMAGTTNAIIRGVGPQQVTGLGTQPLLGSKTLGSFDPLGGFLGQNDIIGKFLFNVTKKITNWGIKALPQSLDQIIAQGFKGMNWTEVTRTTKVLGITIGKSVKNLYSDLDVGVTGQITRVIRSMADTVREAGKAFGISGEQFNKAMSGFVVNFGTLATKGLKSDEIEKAVQQVFSSMSDDMAQQFQSRFDLGLEPFMRAGQGMFETLVMVANGINTATGILAQFGIEAINYQQIIQKQGDVASEIVRQSIVAFEGVGSAIGAYVDQAVGSAEELMSVYRDLLIVSDVAKVVGFNMNDLTQALIVTSGGVAQFLSNLTTYQTEIAGGSEYARQIITLRREFGKLGLALPDSNRGFVRLVNSINTSTEAGQKLYAQVLSLADAFSKAQAEAAKLEELRAKYLPTDSMKGYRDQIQQVAKDFADIIEGTLARLPGGPTYLKRTNKIDVLRDRIDSRDDDKAIIQAEIDTLEAKAKLTAKEKQRLASLRQQRKDLSDEIAGYQKQIDDINKLIAKNPKSQALLEERAKLMEEQGDALIKTLADIWDSMTQAINQAKETLKSIQDSIFELAGGAGGESIKYGMANARRITAESAYNAYSGNDITKLNALADAYYKGIMDEYQAKLELIEAPKKALEKERELRQKAHDEEVAALEKQLSKVTELRDAIEQIQKYSLSLKLGSQSTLSPGDQMREAQRQYEDLLKRAQGGDVKALQEITSGAGSYLELAQKYFGSGTQYANIYDGVAKAMEELGAMNPGDADSIQAKIDKLNEEHGKYLESIDKQIADLNIDQQIKDLQAATVEKLQALADNLGPRISEAEKQAADDMKKLFDETVKANTWNERQTTALEELAKTFGVVMPDAGKPEPALPTPTDDWVQDIFDKWNSGQTGYKPPAPAFTMSTAADGRAMTTQSMENMPVIIDAPKPINLENMPKFINDLKQPSPYTDEVVEELRLLQREMKALVVTQSGANPEVIAQLQTLNDRLESLERQQRIKA